MLNKDTNAVHSDVKSFEDIRVDMKKTVIKKTKLPFGKLAFAKPAGKVFVPLKAAEKAGECVKPDND